MKAVYAGKKRLKKFFEDRVTLGSADAITVYERSILKKRRREGSQ